MNNDIWNQKSDRTKSQIKEQLIKCIYDTQIIQIVKHIISEHEIYLQWRHWEESNRSRRASSTLDKAQNSTMDSSIFGRNPALDCWQNPRERERFTGYFELFVWFDWEENLEREKGGLRQTNAGFRAKSLIMTFMS